jgi:hypothetical protein
MGGARLAPLLLVVSLVLLQAQAWPGEAPLNGEGKLAMPYDSLRFVWSCLDDSGLTGVVCPVILRMF